ncbi:hypothetical protein [Salinigranum sp. GCM10025319]|uniref:hypothetical protein n=1 Tax=Salinigranum sp. GCM10025319 TaxID=3252687 RepID=UPI0036065891
MTLTVTVTRSELPIVVHATTCDEETSESKEIDVDPPSPSRPNTDDLDVNPALPCTPLFCPENVRCSEAQVELVMKGNEIRRLCDRANRLRGTWIEYTTLAVLMSVVTAALFAAAIVVAQIPPWGLIAAAALAAAALAAAITTGVFIGNAIKARRELDDVERDLRTARHEFDDIYATVSSECCPGCADNDIVFQPEC